MSLQSFLNLPAKGLPATKSSLEQRKLVRTSDAGPLCRRERASPPPWITSGAVPVRSAEWSRCPDSPPGALAHGHRPRGARWCALVFRSTRSTCTLPWAQVFDRVRPAAALGRLDALALHHAARARNKSRPGLAALASPRVGGGSTRRANTNFDVQLGVHLSLWLQVCGAHILPAISRSRAPSGCAGERESSCSTADHSFLQDARLSRTRRVVRWPKLVKPLRWQLTQHAYCVSPAAQIINLLTGGVLVRYVS